MGDIGRQESIVRILAIFSDALKLVWWLYWRQGVVGRGRSGLYNIPQGKEEAGLAAKPLHSITTADSRRWGEDEWPVIDGYGLDVQCR
jgi:hypothetical protein